MTNSDFNFRTPKTKNKVSLTAELARIDRIGKSSFSPIPVTLGEATLEKSDLTILLEGMHINLDNLTEEEIKEIFDTSVKIKKMIDAAVMNGFYVAGVSAVMGAAYGTFFQAYDPSCYSLVNGFIILAQAVVGLLGGATVGFGMGAVAGATYAYPDKRQKYEAAINALKQISIEADKLGKYVAQPVISNLPAAGYVAGKSCGLFGQKLNDLNSVLRSRISARRQQ